ncbi:hypothetical protein CDL12_14758 [Handroanthus impetiginosus]|uniref:Uncharacterized protein n=1 Tax=Handroanthus impetiginosus TaxID=429701 RepID=A0A2G9H537_9LAMI|nr:hypothetical protein CDL12_14758 [Handroanthus impetiginosus]
MEIHLRRRVQFPTNVSITLLPNILPQMKIISTSLSTSLQQINLELFVEISAQAVIAVCGYALSGSSSHHPAVDFAAGATAVGFLCSWMAVAVGRKKPRLADFMAKISFTAAAADEKAKKCKNFHSSDGKFKWKSIKV